MPVGPTEKQAYRASVLGQIIELVKAHKEAVLFSADDTHAVLSLQDPNGSESDVAIITKTGLTTTDHSHQHHMGPETSAHTIANQYALVQGLKDMVDDSQMQQATYPVDVPELLQRLGVAIQLS
ncbi:hypothetical protein BV20DRAFT_1058346 [Pilatotrama ljubarskyi]|nr:hypothetical protein BV20DRAFT_1058346 [Pilatotrama ljubarskyi]